MSPSFPIGGFGYSYGLEAAFSAQALENDNDLLIWIKGLIAFGSIRSDAILLLESQRIGIDAEDLAHIQENAEALCSSEVRLLEQYALGRSFVEAVTDAYEIDLSTLPEPICVSVAVGAVAARFNIPQRDSVIGFTHNTINALIQAALRLAPIGQRRGLKVLSQLEPLIEEMADELSDATLEDLNASALIADTLAMQHETLKSRIFLS
jgi:urease accessory protein